MNKFDFNSKIPILCTIDDFYDKSSESIALAYNRNIDTKFIGMTSDELKMEKQFLLDELEIWAVFMVLCYIESLFRIDFILRCENKNKWASENLSLYYKKHHQSNKRYYQYSLKDVIFAGWKESFPEENCLINQLSQAFEYRNWIAHGRYWKFKDNPNKYTYDYVKTIAEKIESQLGGSFKCQPKLGESAI